MATSLSRMMKQVSSSLLPLATRRTPSCGNCNSAIFITPLKTSTTSIRSIGTSSSTDISSHLSRANSVSNHRPTSAPAIKESNSDDTLLLRNIQSEIDRIEKKFKVPEAPKEFPFKIEYERGAIRLTREYQDEQIKVIGCRVYGYPRCLDLVVSLTKKSGSTLEFKVSAEKYRFQNIDSWAIKNPNAPDDEGPNFLDLDGGLQQDFYRYLGDRGIKPSITEFLCDYMDKKYENDVNEAQKEQIPWFKKLKNFLEN